MPPSPDEPARSSPLFTGFMVIALLAVWGFVLDAIHISEGGSIDLRNRITGVRVAASHQDPYTFKWDRTQSDLLCDPFNSPASPVSHTTVTPLTLTTFLPFKNLDYRLTRWLWFLVEYSALALGFLAWLRSSPRENRLMGALLTCLFCLTPHWRLHIDRGQSYVILSALLLIMASFGQKTGTRALWLESLTGSLLAGLRPPFGLLLGVSAVRRKPAALLAAVTGLAVWITLPVLLAGTAIWKNYFAAMKVHAANYLGQVQYPNARFSASETIEGLPIDTFLHFPRIPFADSSIYKLISFQLSPGILLTVWAALAALCGFLFLRRREILTPRFWWALSAWLLIADFLLPAYRYTYNDILLWPMLLLGLNALTGRARTVWCSASASLLLFHTALWFLPKSLIASPSHAALALAFCVAVLSFFPPGQVSPDTPGPVRP